MKKIGFIVPWHGENIPGGAEAALRSVSSHLNDKGMEVEILTTCVDRFTSDWSTNFYKPGDYYVNGILTRRFKVRKRNTELFDFLNGKILQGQNLTLEEESSFMHEMINSPDLYDYIKENKDKYGLFIFIPYMFGTTYFGYKACPEKTVMIPCAHEESYIHLNIYKEMFEGSKGMIFNAEPEKKLVNELFDMSNVAEITPGLGMDTDICGNAKDFIDNFNIKEPFILYAGRKDVGKNIYTLINYYSEYCKRNKENLKLVLIGGGKIDIPKDNKDDIIDLGFVDIQDKYNAYAAATMLCQPSIHESFSYVIMESWLCGRPVIVHEECDVTTDFVRKSNGGLYFKNYFEFEGCVNYILNNNDVADKMGDNGKKFVKDNFTWDRVMNQYIEFIEKLAI